MDFEELLYGIFPISIAVACVFWVIQITKTKMTYLTISLAFLNLLILGISTLTLINILNGAYPTFAPHIGIGISIAILSIQQLTSNKKRTKI